MNSRTLLGLSRHAPHLPLIERRPYSRRFEHPAIEQNGALLVRNLWRLGHPVTGLGDLDLDEPRVNGLAASLIARPTSGLRK